MKTHFTKYSHGEEGQAAQLLHSLGQWWWWKGASWFLELKQFLLNNALLFFKMVLKYHFRSSAILKLFLISEHFLKNFVYFLKFISSLKLCIFLLENKDWTGKEHFNNSPFIQYISWLYTRKLYILCTFVSVYKQNKNFKETIQFLLMPFVYDTAGTGRQWWAKYELMLYSYTCKYSSP